MRLLVAGLQLAADKSGKKKKMQLRQLVRWYRAASATCNLQQVHTSHELLRKRAALNRWWSPTFMFVLWLFGRLFVSVGLLLAN